MIFPGNWTTQIESARAAAQAIAQAKPTPVSLAKKYRPQIDMIYTANFRPPAVPRFRAATTDTGEHSG